MGGFFGAVNKEDAINDVFFGTDYHSHLGTRSGGMAAYDPDFGLQRQIHSIEKTPFRTKFDKVFDEMHGPAAIGCISDTDPQPLLIKSHLGTFAISTIGIINNKQKIIDDCIDGGATLNAMTKGETNNTELIGALISRKDSFAEGIRYAQEKIEGTASILILTEDGKIIAARDKVGRLPVILGRREDGYCVSFESFAYQKLGYADYRELGPGEAVEMTADGVTTLTPPGKKKRICAFLWSYYGYPTATYEGVNVEVMRVKNGEIMARNDREKGFDSHLDFVAGVPDSGTAHAIGYSNNCDTPFGRPFIKYTQTWLRSFMPTNQSDRNKVAKMKLLPVNDLINGKDLLFVDDSIVRGTQLRETVEFLYSNGAKSVHMRSACPPIMYGCKYLNFSRATSDMELISRSTIMELEGEEGFKHLDEYCDGSTERGKNLRNTICKKLNFDSLDFQTLSGIIEAIGIDEDELCTYCWSGKE